MQLKTLTLTDFRCFHSFSLQLDPHLTVLVGKNGAGKTAILDAIAIGLGAFITRLPNVAGKDFDRRSTDIRAYGDEQKMPYTRIRVENVSGVKWDRTKRRDQADQTRTNIPTGLGVKALNEHVDHYIGAHNQDLPFELPIFAYYGTGRGVFDIPRRRRDFLESFERFDAYQDTLDAKADFRQFFKYFYFLQQLESEQKIERRDFDYTVLQLDAVRRAIEKALPYISDPQIKLNPLRFLINWHQSNESATLRIEQLSDGYRITIAMIADIAARMAGANPAMNDPLQSEGVILIDEIELHLHPQLQREIISILRRVFPKIQYICTTHSAPVVSHIGDGTVFILQDVIDGIQASKVNTYGHDANYLLERVFDTSRNPAQIQERLDECARLIDREQLERAQNVLSQLESEIGADNPDILYFRGLIQFMADEDIVTNVEEPVG